MQVMQLYAGGSSEAGAHLLDAPDIQNIVWGWQAASLWLSTAYHGTEKASPFACSTTQTSCVSSGCEAAASSSGLSRSSGPPPSPLAMPPASFTSNRPAATSQMLTLVAK